MGDRTTASGRVVPPIAFAFAILTTWQLITAVTGVSELLLPSPMAVAAAIYRSFGLLIWHASITLAEALAGLIIGVVFGSLLAIACCYFPTIGRMVTPYGVALKTTPIIVLAPLLIVWLGNGYLSKITMAATSAFFPVYVSTWAGLTSVEQEWLDLMQLHGASRWKCLIMLRIPHALPEFFTGFRIASSLAMVGAVVAEFASSKSGIGHLITTATYYLNMDTVFAGVILLCLQGLLLYGSVGLLQRRVVFWQSER